MTSANGSARPASRFTPEEDAEDFDRLVRETRSMKNVSVAELARRAGVTPDDVLAFEAGRVVPAKPPFTAYMTAMGFTP